VPLILDKEFVDKFDVIVVSWRFDYFKQYQELFKGKVVIFETVGQSDLKRESELKQARENGLLVVRIMPSESRYPGFAGADKFVYGWVDYDHTNLWTGSDTSILTIKASIQKRARACNTNEYLAITKDLPRKLYGYDNDGVSFCLGTLTDTEMIHKYRSARLSFGLGSKPAPIVYTVLEPMARGCPLVTWGPRLGNFPGMSTYTMHEHLENGVNGFYSDDLKELRHYCELLLKDLDLARTVGEAGRQLVKEKFSYENVKNNWKELFKEVGIL
jgi:glycosyltransferase involved in cell wall biosynthesis